MTIAKKNQTNKSPHLHRFKYFSSRLHGSALLITHFNFFWRKTTSMMTHLSFFSPFSSYLWNMLEFPRIYNINKIEKTEKILRVQILMLGKTVFFLLKNIYRYVYLFSIQHIRTHVSIQYCSCSKSCSTKYKNIYAFLEKYWNVLVMNFKVWYISLILIEKSLKFRFQYSQSLGWCLSILISFRSRRCLSANISRFLVTKCIKNGSSM